jgi:hypothetical protein
MDAYELGHSDALASMGVTKEAAAGRIAATAAKLWPGISQFGRNVGTNFKNIMIGTPLAAVDQIRAGTALGKGGLIRAGFNPGKGLMGKVVGGLMYGMPAYQGYQIMQSDDPNKAEQIGKLLGGTAAGLGTWRAFGMLGSMAAAPLGAAIGGQLGKGVSAVRGNKQQLPPNYQQQTPAMSPYQYNPYGMASTVGWRMSRPNQWGPQR